MMWNYARYLVLFLLCCTMTTAFAAAPKFVPERVPVAGDAWPGEKDNYQFVILGDKTSGGEALWHVYDEAIETINKIAPDFVVSTGDHINGHMEERAEWDEEWQEYRDHAQHLKCPLVMSPGNHDIANQECYEFWKEDFGATYFYFRYGQSLFLILNTEEERFDGRGPIWEAMMTFAETALANEKDATHCFLFFHKPMWIDPRFTKDWERLLNALGTLPFTAIAGHEHYLSVSYHNGNAQIIMNPTGAGVQASEVRAFGGFHAIATVNVDGDNVDIQIVETDGTILPLDISPASFRKSINVDVVQLDALPPEREQEALLKVRGIARLRNPFDKAITVELQVAPLRASGWVMLTDIESGAELDANVWTQEVDLEPGAQDTLPLYFRVSPEVEATPPAVTWRIKYDGHWIAKEDMTMEEVNAAPLYPLELWRSPEHWQVVGPFDVGPINADASLATLKKDNPNFFKVLGPEEGFEPGKEYEGGLSWFAADESSKGLLNHNGILGTKDLASAYNYVAVYSPVAQKTHAVMQADNFAQMYINGELQEKAQAFRAPGRWVYVPLSLNAGWNRVVVKVINNRGDWFLRWLIADPEGTLQFSDGVPAS